MRTVKIKFVGFWPDMKPETQPVYRILSENYNTVISDDPDYIICSCFEPFYDYCKYPQVRIMTVGENYIPDFNLVDYAICPYPISFQDRCFYKPVCHDSRGHSLELERLDRTANTSILSEKQFFANFISSHESENGIRGGFFRELSRYKRVESPGTFLNNMHDAETVSWFDTSKSDFQKKCKFTLCFESTKHEGFVTEKITDAFYANTIPIYYGSNSAKEIFNPKAFIHISDYKSWDEVIERIIELDNNDDMYLEMLNQPILNDPHFFSKLQTSLEEYVLHIFEQPIEQAYRRSMVYSAKNYQDYLINASKPKEYSTRALICMLAKRLQSKGTFKR